MALRYEILGGAGAVSRTKKALPVKTPAATPVRIRKLARQPNLEATKPPKGGAISGPSNMAAKSRPEAFRISLICKA